MKKRIISIFTTLAMLGTFASISGCSTQEDKDASVATATQNATQAPAKTTLDKEGLLNVFTANVGSDYIYFLPADYDGDGTLEAFGITADSEMGDGLYSGVTIWFINSEGECTIAESNTYGLLKETITVPNGSFITWCATAGGSSSSGLVFGCKDGELFEPQVSGKYAAFGDKTMSYSFSDVNDFTRLGCDYIGYDSYYSNEGHIWEPIAYDYDSDTREFVQAAAQTQTFASGDYDYSKILAGDFSDFVGTWTNGYGMSFNLLSNGSTENEANATDAKFVPTDFQKQSDGSYMWYISITVNGKPYEGYWYILYPVGVNMVDYKGSVVNTDTSRVRIWSGNGDITNEPSYVYYKD